MTENHGIDYGMGTSNIDRKAGIRFGVIPLHALHCWAIEDFEDDYGEPTCGHCGNDLTEYNEDNHGDYPEIHGCCDFACETCERVVDSSDAYREEPIGSYLDDGEYKAELHSDNDIFIIKSPYFTFARFCSPCAPGACYLLNPTDDSGPKAYCFGPDWFEDKKAPYPVYLIADGSLVQAAPAE